MRINLEDPADAFWFKFPDPGRPYKPVGEAMADELARLDAEQGGEE